MKTIEELGISPWPWRIDCGMISDANGNCVYGNGWDADSYDKHILAAAPELYNALSDAIALLCSQEKSYLGVDHCSLFNSKTKECSAVNKSVCPICKLRAALSKASGEETK